MIKFAFISTISFLLLSIFGTDDGVFVTHETPATMAAGSTAQVSVSINKNQIEGFGKLVIEIPNGFTVENIDSKNASFTYQNQKAKYIWIEMPEEEEFTVLYNLTAPEDFRGTETLKGVFSYIKENQRVDYEMLDKNISLGDDVLASNDEPVTDDESPVAAAEEEEESQNVGVDVSSLACKRTFERISDEKVKVILSVENSNLTGFGKIQENYDEKFIVTEEDSDGAITTIEDGFIKFVWFEVPEENSFQVSYNIESADLASEEPILDGTFTYLSGNNPVENPVVSTNVLDFPEADLAMTEEPEVIEPEVTEPEEISTPEIDDQEEALAQKSDEVVEDMSLNTSSIPEPETGVTYKVQIVAGPNTVGKQYMRKRYNFEENFGIENHDGWVKYTTGKFGEYKFARDHREVVTSRYDFDGPFVTAYNYGERITVQEALMITNQQWYQ